VAPTPWGNVLPLLQLAGHREQKNSKQETGQTVLTITKALTKTTFRAKTIGGDDKKIPDVCPHFQIRSGATGV